MSEIDFPEAPTKTKIRSTIRYSINPPAKEPQKESKKISNDEIQYMLDIYNKYVWDGTISEFGRDFEWFARRGRLRDLLSRLEEMRTWIDSKGNFNPKLYYSVRITAPPEEDYEMLRS